ncbi:sulfurtransferase [Mycobacterium sp. 1423905.2]|uniref:sulfurtransferase n=1 Tax=Mycobacterium sp. 1423905.2 TaxID=1856859 RepID=UPI0008022197|nr:sulfurtransferase [Mycobacterium sp. 1423905.2]OBJ50806.1 thiosulfate sulfurtransferase [Mycobacterium sp. 1423905.2]
MDSRAQVLINATELVQRLQSGDPVVVLDVRWRLEEPDGLRAYLDGHIPGAVYVPLEDELTDHSVAGRGRHPLPSGASLQAAGRRWGINEGDLIVVYDDWNRAGSGRAWWVLTAAGLDVRILDGGLSAWRSAGGTLESGPVEPQPGNVTVRHQDLYAGKLPTLTAEQVNTQPLLDARAPERFRGEVEPVDAVAGHIPGAKNLPSGAVLAADGTFLDEQAVGRLLSDRGVNGSVGAYCGSGVTASVVVAALAAAGHQAALFPGSWSEWISDPDRPIGRGAD